MSAMVLAGVSGRFPPAHGATDGMETNMSNPEVTDIHRTNGVAGQFQYSAQIRYPDEPAARTVVFVGTAYGSAVVMVTDATPGGDRVSNPERFGDKLTADWVRKFFA